MADETKAHYDEEDVKAALKRKTADGSGFDTEDELPESDYEDFPEGVENDHDGDNEGSDKEDDK